MKEKFLGLLKKKTGKITMAIITVIVVLGVCALLMYNSTATVDTSAMNQLIKESSELTTAKLTCTGMTEYTDEGVKFINKADFIMVYEATVRAGIKLDDVKVNADDKVKKIVVSVPKATVQEVSIDEKSIKYFDEKIVLFNTDEKEDNNKAISMAKEDVVKEAAVIDLLNMADKQSATLIKGILSNAVPKGYIIEVNVK